MNTEYRGPQAPAGYGAGWTSYNDTDDRQAISPREHLNAPVYSPASSYNSGQFFSARTDGFGSATPMPAAAPAGMYRNSRPESGATIIESRGSAATKEALMGEEGSPAKKRRRGQRKCCGNGRYCYCFSRKCCCIFLPILAVILAGLGVTFYFVWPRIPAVEFDRVGVAQPLTDVSPNGMAQQLLGGATINRNGTVTVPLVIHLSVTNPNYIPWTIHNVTVDGFLSGAGADGGDFPVGEGGLREPFKMPKKSVDNDMPIYFNFRLDTANDNYRAAAEIVQRACSANGPNLRFYYKAKVILKAISWLGIKPTISDTIKFACPAREIEDMGINISDLTGLAASDIAGLA
ncbi:hypothetical protein GGF46_001458 [Coemansia sp. RSA 552]|nr:hypothetical protein GGF46_001458 [Coemansia sp. RSA 552]